MIGTSLAAVNGHPAPDAVAANAEIPSNRNLPAGCYFRDRCAHAAPGCEQPQALVPSADGSRMLRCHRADTIALGTPLAHAAAHMPSHALPA